LAVQDTRTPPLLNAIYEQITRAAAGYDDLVDCSDDYVEDQVTRITKGTVAEELSRAHQQELHADLLAAEREREAIVSKLRADLTAAMDHLDRQTKVVSTKDHIIQSVTEESQVARVRLKYAEDKITHLNAKLQRERDRRLRKKEELLDEIRRLKQDAQEQLDTLRHEAATLHPPHADGRSLLYRQPTTRPYDTCQLPPATPPISPATNVGPISEVTQDHRAALEKLFERMRQGEYESAQDAVKPNSEEQEQESRLQDELAVTKEQLGLAEEEVLTMRRDLDQSRETLREVKTHIAGLQSEWEMCMAMLREAQDAWRSSIADRAEVIELLRVSQAESEESRVKCSQVTFLCAALQERVTELEAITPVHTDSESRFLCPTSTDTGMCAHPIYAVL
jgi:chromosome segregation ATPase